MNRDWTEGFRVGLLLTVIAILPSYFFWMSMTMFDIDRFLTCLLGIFSVVWLPFCFHSDRVFNWLKKVVRKASTREVLGNE